MPLRYTLRTVSMRSHHRHFLFILLFWVAGAASLLAQKHTISGYVSDAQSGERLIGATVVDRRSGQGTTTNTYGFFSLTLPADSVYLSVAYIGYQSDGFLFKLAQNQTFNIALKESALLKEVEIVAEKYERIEDRAQMSRIDIPITQIKRVPALLGEVDVLKALQLLPGVSGGGEGQSGLYVRGGGPDQNLILLDGVPVYNASHLFGFFSVFNADAIKDVTLTKGGFPARYGGRLSSVIEINMKEGNENELHGEGSIGIISSKLTLEGPIKKGRSSFIVSGRRTYIDILARPLIKNALKEEGSEGSFGYYFYDLNAKANYRFSEKDRLYLSFYGGSDKFYSNIIDKYGEQPSYENELNAGLGWGNLISALRWNHVFSPKLFANTTLTYSQYRFNTKAENGDRRYENKVLTSEDFISIKYLNGINDWAAKIDFDYAPNPQHLIKFGASAIAHQFNPGKFNVKFIATDNNQNYNFTLNQPEESAGEFAAYGEDDYKVTSRLRLNYGLHFSAFTPKGKAYFSLQPRFNVRYLLNQGWALKGGFSTMRQYINLLTNENLSLPTDLWLPSTDIIKPQDSWQAAIGVAKTFADEYEFSVEGYYKEMKNVLSFREGSSLFQFSNWEGRVTQGDGTAYGAEFFVQKKKGNFSGWIGYTLSWAWRQFDDLNFGKKYPYKFDRRHDFEIVGTYKLTDRIQMSGTWVFSTGNAVTFPTSTYLGQGANLGYVDFLDHTPERNNFRFPSYNRLDVGIDFKKQKRRYERTWSVGAYNAYSRKNPFFLYIDYTYEYDPLTGRNIEQKNLKQVSLFPIIPYISWAFKF